VTEMQSHEEGLDMGVMSTLVWGEEQVVFNARQEAFHRAAERGDVVIVGTAII
jgi:hypothetical protein